MRKRNLITYAEYVDNCCNLGSCCPIEPCQSPEQCRTTKSNDMGFGYVIGSKTRLLPGQAAELCLKMLSPCLEIMVERQNIILCRGTYMISISLTACSQCGGVVALTNDNVIIPCGIAPFNPGAQNLGLSISLNVTCKCCLQFINIAKDAVIIDNLSINIIRLTDKCIC